MPTTPVYALPYPQSSDVVDVPLHIQQLATASENAFGALNAAGPYLSRPTAAAARNGGVYYATDTLGTFRSDGSQWALIQQGAPVVTNAQMNAAPFTTPYDGQHVRLLVDAANGIEWRFAYRSASASAYKWEFIGGAPLYYAVDVNESTSSTTATDLGTPGPLLTLPRGGDYFVQARCDCTQGSGTTFNAELQIWLDNANAGIYGHTMLNGAGSGWWSKIFIQGVIANANAGQVVKMRYLTSQNSAGFATRRLTLVPLRVS